MLGLVAHHLKPGMWRRAPQPVGDGAFRRLARKVDLELLALLSAADCLGRTGHFDCAATMDWFLDRARALGVEHEGPTRCSSAATCCSSACPRGRRSAAF